MPAKQSRSSRWRKIREMAWQRDRKNRAPCHICHQPIDYTLAPASAPMAWSPDHVVPVSKAPQLELDLDNIAASHRHCNEARGDGTRHTDIGQQSRVW